MKKALEYYSGWETPEQRFARITHDRKELRRLYEHGSETA